MFEFFKALFGRLRAPKGHEAVLDEWVEIPYRFQIDWYAPTREGERYMVSQASLLSQELGDGSRAVRLFRRKP